MATYKYLGDYGSDGTIMGRASTDKIGFYGATPVTKPSVDASTITTAAITTTTNNYGFANTTQANDLTSVVDSIRTALSSLGLCTVS
jgi:hypothetical protein